MAFARHNQFRAPHTRTILDWFTGTGFLAVDAGAFFVALMVLLPWNLYRSPGDLWVAQPLRTWAFVLTFHALLVGAIALARGIVRSPESDRSVSLSGTRPVSGWSSPRTSQPAQPTASTLLAQEWARRWLDDDRTEVAEMMQQSETISTRRASDSGRGNLQWSPEISPWPDAPAPRPPLDAEAILSDWLDEQASAYVASPPSEIDPLRAAAGLHRTDPPEDGEAALDSELEWKWVEAAASAWLARHDTTPNGHSDSNGHA